MLDLKNPVKFACPLCKVNKDVVEKFDTDQKLIAHLKFRHLVDDIKKVLGHNHLNVKCPYSFVCNQSPFQTPDDVLDHIFDFEGEHGETHFVKGLIAHCSIRPGSSSAESRDSPLPARVPRLDGDVDVPTSRTVTSPSSSNVRTASEMARLKDELANCKRDKSRAESVKASMQDNLTRTKQAYKDLEQKVADLEKQQKVSDKLIDELKGQTGNKDVTITDLEAQVIQLKKELSKARSKIVTSEGTAKELKDSKTKHEYLSETNAELKKENKDLTKEVEDLQQDLAVTVESKDKLATELDQSKKRFSHCQRGAGQGS